VLCFVEVKTRRRNPRTRPADAVTAAKRRRLLSTAKRYLRLLGSPRITWRLDVVEVIYANNRLSELRHWPDEIKNDN
jgi:Holliday junction resolvase-like predicted endonuclease